MTVDENSPAATHRRMLLPQSINHRRATERHHQLSPFISGTIERLDREQPVQLDANRDHDHERGS